MWIVQVQQRGTRTIWQFEWSPRTYLGPQAMFACSIHIQQDGAWKEIDGIIIEMLVSVPQTR